jgi:dienelactone hydrolase
MARFVLSLLAGAAWIATLTAAEVPVPDRPADLALREYFRAETARLHARTAQRLEELATGPDPAATRAELRGELLDMLGLRPLPERTDLKPVVTGVLERPDFIVERLHFQSLPGLYVTANLYRPRSQEGPLPGVLYVCGHAQVRTNGVSCGNKTGYQHHGIWFARHGYVCLLIDTLQLGEIEGLHHGTSRLGQWWWNSRGYSPAGVEAWNGIRALDYLQSRPEVDPNRLGMTGRSGGGSYTWTTAAIDERVRVAAPVAGITDLEDQVVNGAIEGHCDCMFFVNTYRWDFAAVLALLAPRPLLIVNTDSDPIFPLDGVERLHAQVRQLYRSGGAAAQLGLVIGPGPHQDTQDLQVPVFRWFNRHLKGADPLVAEPAVKLFPPLDLRVFDALPPDQRNTTAQDWFGPTPAAVVVPEDPDALLARLRTRAFAGWPDATPAVAPEQTETATHEGWRTTTWRYPSQDHVPMTLQVATRTPPGPHPRRMVLRVEDASGWAGLPPRIPTEPARPTAGDHAPSADVAVLAPRGIGSGAWSGDDRRQTQIRRRFMLLGQTLDGMRVWDIRRGIQVLRRVAPTAPDVAIETEIEIEARGTMAANALYAALFEPGVSKLRLRDLPKSLRDGGPDYLNVLSVLDLRDAVDLVRRRGVAVELAGN